MKTITEYIQKKQISSKSTITLQDICNIFNGDLHAANYIESCSLVSGSFKWYYQSKIEQNFKWQTTDGDLILIYFKDSEDKFDPDLIIKLFNGHRGTAKMYLQAFADNVNANEVVVNPLEKCIVKNDVPNSLFFENEHLELKVFGYNDNPYKDLQIDSRL